MNIREPEFRGSGGSQGTSVSWALNRFPDFRSILFWMLFIWISVQYDFCFSETQSQNPAEIYRQAGLLKQNCPAEMKEEYDEVITNGWERDHVGIRELLRVNEPALSLFKQAAKFEFCRFPDYAPDESDKNLILPLVNLVQLIEIETKLFEKEKRSTEALSNYTTLARYAQHLYQQEHHILTHRGKGMWIKSGLIKGLRRYGDREVCKFLNRGGLRKELIALQKADSGLADAFKEEVTQTKATMREVSRRMESELAANGFNAERKRKALSRRMACYQQKVTAIENEYLGLYLAGYKDNNPEDYREKVLQLNARLRKETDGFSPTKFAVFSLVAYVIPIGDWLAEYWADYMAKLMSGNKPDYTNLIHKHYQLATEMEMLIIASGLSLFEAAHNRQPENLAELVPAFVSEVPLDPFNRFEQLKYIRKGNEWVVYSFGPDKNDDSGEIEYDAKVKDPKGDLVIGSNGRPSQFHLK